MLFMKNPNISVSYRVHLSCSCNTAKQQTLNLEIKPVRDVSLSKTLLPKIKIL